MERMQTERAESVRHGAQPLQVEIGSLQTCFAAAAAGCCVSYSCVNRAD
jgi:hypothetical protein